MPKRESNGEPSWPVRVVAPTSVKRSIGSGMARAPAPVPVTSSMRKSSIAG